MNNLAWMLAQQKLPGAQPLAGEGQRVGCRTGGPLMDTLAYVLALEKQPERAVALQRKAMAQNPEDPNLRLTLARIHVVNGDRTQARAELDALAKLGDKFSAQDEVARLVATLDLAPAAYTLYNPRLQVARRLRLKRRAVPAENLWGCRPRFSAHLAHHEAMLLSTLRAACPALRTLAAGGHAGFAALCAVPPHGGLQ
ncbi:MAG: tetratricopeptide repeat protein [Betaproteobacteria bacterium]|nr:tetratricopeptide repeat protein [Betaproteobacteria bacterium]